tara:strand:+ start:1512 stop:3071 length:1560 start_codon:yes stop_codon:yes gene_type:complete
MNNEMIFHFDHPHSGTIAEISDVVGGKGASLWAMTSKLGLPTPAGFTIGVDTCAMLDKSGITEDFTATMDKAIAKLEAKTGRQLGDPENPLLLAVRSGASVSMPGMMETILNVGVTPLTLPALRNITSDRRFALDSYQRFLDCFCRSILRSDLSPYDAKTQEKLELADHIKNLEAVVGEQIGSKRLCDARYLLNECIHAVIRSSHSSTAQGYRKKTGLAESLGTAVTVQAMVFGNTGASSGTGVAFSRDPNSGEQKVCGDWISNAQGDDVVAGGSATSDISVLASTLPSAYVELKLYLEHLEIFYQDMVDVEFTVDRGKLWILQARVGKRTARAASRIAVELANSERFELNKKDALATVAKSLATEKSLTKILTDNRKSITTGIGASVGVASGLAVFTSEEAIKATEDGKAVVLVRQETSPADVHGMAVANGILTSLGGLMSHAAVVARDWNLPAVVGAIDMQFTADAVVVGTVKIHAGDIISIDGNTGEVFVGEILSTADEDPYLEQLEAWAEEKDED